MFMFAGQFVVFICCYACLLNYYNSRLELFVPNKHVLCIIFFSSWCYYNFDQISVKSMRGLVIVGVYILLYLLL